MRGKVCLITGASSGIGKETAVVLARMGANVVIHARSTQRGSAAAAEIREGSGSNDVDLIVAELASLAAVRSLADQFRRRHQQLHVLINNAGAYHADRRLTEDGYEMTFGVNHLAHFLLTNLLLDMLRASAPSRIINVSSGAHMRATLDLDDLQGETRYRGMAAYGRSKLANVLFTNELARRLAGTAVTANSLHPGVVKTGFGRNNGGAVGAIFRLYHALAGPFVLSSEKGAETSVYLASSPDAATESGKYFVDKKAAASSSLANDPELAARLWQVSEELTR
jgi:NAD(P)-dependent dehydrogenase (short-subunit alcohol dehydrogenase family)